MNSYDIFDQGFSITLVSNDGQSVCLQGQDATTFRDGFEACPNDWTVSRYINQVGYDILFDEKG